MTTPDAFPLKATPIHVSDEILDNLRTRLALPCPASDSPAPSPAFRTSTSGRSPTSGTS